MSSSGLPEAVGAILVFLALLVLAFVPTVIRLRGSKSERAEGLDVYWGSYPLTARFSRRAESADPAGERRPGWRPPPCALRHARWELTGPRSLGAEPRQKGPPLAASAHDSK